MNFGGKEIVYDYLESAIVILPVPYDETSTWLKGAAKGPEAIMEASVNLEFFDIETKCEIHRSGIFTADAIIENETPEALAESVYRKVRTLLADKKFVVITGGNHTVSIGAFHAFSEYFEDLSILQLDAHTDLRNEYEGSCLNHACTMARAREYAHTIQVGIRSMSAEELPVADQSNIFFAHDLYYDKSLYRKAVKALKGNVYVTIDLDVFDPSLIPSVGTPEPGGPHYFELMHFLREVASQRNIVGFDVVELSPVPSNKMPDFVAAKIIYQLLSYIFCNK
jgi:agmatinase